MITGILIRHLAHAPSVSPHMCLVLAHMAGVSDLTVLTLMV